MSLVNIFRDRSDPNNGLPPEGVRGTYRVELVLARPGITLAQEREIPNADALEGDSHLAISKPAFEPPMNPDANQIKLYGVTENGRFEFTGYPNSRGFLGKLISGPFMAGSFQDAQQKGYRAATAAISNIAAVQDIPLDIFQIRATHLESGNVNLQWTSPAWEAPLILGGHPALGKEYRSYISVYREALSSNSPIYRFLCFYKIVEAIRARRKRLEREAKRSNATYTKPQEHLPTDARAAKAWLSGLFAIDIPWDDIMIAALVSPEVGWGASFEDVIEKRLKPIRTQIAHLISDVSEIPLSADELVDTHKVADALPLLRCVTRRMLKSEFPREFLNFRDDDGNLINDARITN